VTVHIDDARHFFQHAQPGYDVVVFALLDSHRLLSTLSSLRLDSYVFTVESFREVKRLLKPDGIQVTAFAIEQEQMRARLYEMLRQAYDGVEPIDLSDQDVKTMGAVFVSGPGQGTLGFSAHPRPVDAHVVPATDDWPFIYAERRSIPIEYLVVLAFILILSTIALRIATQGTRLPDGHFFFLGAGFLLLETKNVTTIALVFGSTWYVNAVVFFSVLLMALLANLLLSITDRVPIALAYGGLFAALALNYLLPLQEFAGASLALRCGLVGGVTALPLFFSGLVFAHSFRHAPDPPHALGSNILGGVFGGVVEYLSMAQGLSFLFWLIAAFYLLSLLRVPHRQRAAIADPGLAG
jgi:hypothetical protein